MKDIKLKALKVKQPIGEFLVASISARELVDIAFSDVREIKDRELDKYIGIQRELQPRRVNEIRKYIHDAPDATFPTAIILSIDEKCAEYDEVTNELVLKPFESDNDDIQSISKKEIAKVLDGQHRIAGFMDSEDNLTFNFDEDFYLNVSIFIGIDIAEQAKIFATVNLAQTKVNKSLVYDLEGLAKGRSPHKTCHQIAVTLNSSPVSPLYHRIKRLGVATPGRKNEPLTQATFVESLIPFISDDPYLDRNLLMRRKKLAPFKDASKRPFGHFFRKGVEGDIDIAIIISNYFDAIKKTWPKAWDGIAIKGNLLPKSNAFRALMRYLKDKLYVELIAGGENEIPSVGDFYEKLKEIDLKDEDFTTKNFVPGSTGESKFYKYLMGEQKEKDFFQSEIGFTI